MNRLDAMQLFLRIAELASYTRAAESLGVTRATASQAVQQLEDELGTQLLHRTTRRVSLTHDGQAYYARCRDLLAEMEALDAMFRPQDQALRGKLRVDMPSRTASNVIIPRLPEFMAAHPELEIELSSSDRRVDVVREGFDCVLRVGELSDSNLVARRLGRLTLGNYASPAYIKRHGMPKTPADLKKSHRVIGYATILGPRGDSFEYREGNREREIQVATRLIVNSTETYLAACLAGLGIIQIPAFGAQEFIRSGHLVELLPDYRAAPMPVSLLYPQRRHLPRRVQVFMDWIAGLLEPHLDR